MKIVRFLLAVFFLPVLCAGSLAAMEPPGGGKWVGSWVSAQQLVEPHNLPPPPGLSGNTLRQVIQPSLDGDRPRLTFSNQYGDGPLIIAAVTVARSAGGSAIEPGSTCPLTFAGERSVTIPPGAERTSDPAPFKVRAFENLAVSTHCTLVPAQVTGHPGSRTTSFIQQGEGVAADSFAAAAPTDHWYLLAALDVWADDSAGAILVLGDSITDGRGSTTNRNDRWPNNLARRLRTDARTANLAVLNQGIGGNRVLRNGLGPSALQRFDRDVLGPPGVRWLILFEGINDLGTAVGARARGEPAATAGDITAGYEQMITRAHARGLRVYGATLMPFQGFVSYNDALSETDRQAINRWIRTSGKFDGVIDFDDLTRDRANSARLAPGIDGGDHLHPSAEGYKVMADGIDPGLFMPSNGR